MKKFILGVVVIGIIALLLMLVLDGSAATVGGGQYVELDLPLVDYLNYDEFFAAQGAFENTNSLPSISRNMAKVEGYSEQNGCSIQVFSDYSIFYTPQLNGSVILTFKELPAGTYHLRYSIEYLASDNRSASFKWRRSESEDWQLDPGSVMLPYKITLREGDQFQVKLYNWNGKTHYYKIWFNLIPLALDDGHMSVSDVRSPAYYNQIGKVYHVGRKYYQIQDPEYSNQYNDYTVLENLGESLCTPDIDYTNFKVYKTTGNRWRILWRDKDALTNPLIYENGLFYVSEPSFAYYSIDTYATLCDALVAMSSEDTKYQYDAIRRYDKALDYDAIDFFDPQNNECFWNVYVEEVYPAAFYSRLSPEHYVSLTTIYGQEIDLESCHWWLPAVFIYQNYTEDYTTLPIELEAVYMRSSILDIGSFYYPSEIVGWMSTTALKFWCATEQAWSRVTSIFTGSAEVSVDDTESSWHTVSPGVDTFITTIITGTGEVISDVKDVISSTVVGETGVGWFDTLRDFFTLDKQPFRDIMGLFKDKFYFITDLQYTIESLLEVFTPKVNARGVQEPPVIYADFSESESEYFQGVGKVVVADFSWYAPYKPYVDTFLSAVIWVFFLFRLYFKLPDIIAGAGSLFEKGQSAGSPKNENRIGFM